jgi:hypothetical protein
MCSCCLAGLVRDVGGRVCVVREDLSGEKARLRSVSIWKRRGDRTVCIRSGRKGVLSASCGAEYLATCSPRGQKLTERFSRCLAPCWGLLVASRIAWRWATRHQQGGLRCAPVYCTSAAHWGLGAREWSNGINLLPWVQHWEQLPGHPWVRIVRQVKLDA